MGHQVTRNGLEIDPEKVEAIQNMKQPPCDEDVRRFIGMVIFLARYIHCLTDVLHLLHNMIVMYPVMNNKTLKPRKVYLLSLYYEIC